MKPRLLLPLFVIAPLHAQPASYKGAEVVLRQVTEQAGVKEEKKANPVEELRLKIRAFHGEAAGLSPADAATRWLALLDTFRTIPTDVLYAWDSRQNGDERLSTNSILAALPPSSAWDALAAAIEARKNEGFRDDALRLLAGVLRGDPSARKQALKDFDTHVKDDKKLEDYEREQFKDYIQRISETLDMLAGSAADKLAAFERKLSEVEKGPDPRRGGFVASLNVPDLVALAGPEKAGPLLVRALKAQTSGVGIEGKKTRSLAARLALEHIADLKAPLWDLVADGDPIALYEALSKKFPDRSRDFNRQEADSVYLISLIANGRPQDAATFARETIKESGNTGFSLDLSVIASMQKQGLGKEVLAFLADMLGKDPALPLWKTYIELSANENESAAALALMKAARARPDLPAAAHTEIDSYFYLALLAADQIDEGVEVLREIIKAGPRSQQADGSRLSEEAKKKWAQVGVAITPEILKQIQNRASGRLDSGEAEAIRLTVQLASIGRLLGRPELLNEGVNSALGVFEKMSNPDGSRSSSLDTMVDSLLDTDRGAEAENLITQELVALAKAAPANRRMGGASAPDALTALAFLYDRAGRHQDVLTLLEKSSLWGAPDLAAFESTNHNGTPLLLIAARALNATGKIDEARKLTRRAVQDFPANDAVYALLVQLGGDDIENQFDLLASRDRFEERPLIWKARVQLDAGRIDEAERTIRKAISIDPSDGEQGKGDRMRAYSVLGDILEKKGDAETAKVMRGAVKAIRISEDADDWWQAGLLARAVQKYEDALLNFADAYCVQSRLAVRYSEMGQFEKAEEHYRRAFELMPDSFGRVESHCFGCEHTFSDKRAQNIAEKVFSELAKKMPDRAQVFYLLGYLRDAQARPLEAAEAYRKAITLDPDYLNAWKRLDDLADTAELTEREREAAALAILRLDPAGHHGRPRIETISDLRRLWDTILKTEKDLPAMETGPIFPLPAAKVEIDKLPEADRWAVWSYPTMFSQRVELRNHFLQNPLVATTGQLMEMVMRK